MKCHSSFGLMRVIKEYIVCNNYTTTRTTLHTFMNAHTFCASRIISEIKRRSRYIMYPGFIGLKRYEKKEKRYIARLYFFLNQIIRFHVHWFATSNEGYLWNVVWEHKTLYLFTILICQLFNQYYHIIQTINKQIS